MSRILLVGEDNPNAERPELALFPAPMGSIGHRLLRILGLPAHLYLRLGRTYLCAGGWDSLVARASAEHLTRDEPSNGWARATLVMLGPRVANAFGYRGEPFTRDTYPPLDSDARVYFRRVYLPHPREEVDVERARALLRAIHPELSWGGYFVPEPDPPSRRPSSKGPQDDDGAQSA